MTDESLTAPETRLKKVAAVTPLRDQGFGTHLNSSHDDKTGKVLRLRGYGE